MAQMHVRRRCEGLVLRILALAPVGIPRAARSSPLAVDGAVFAGVFNLVNAVV